MNSFRNVVSAIICITLAVVLSGCTNADQSDTTATPDEAIPHIEALFTKLEGMESCTAGGVRDQLRIRAELLRQMASYGEVAIPYLLDTLELQRDCPDEYLFELEDVLAQMCAKYPEAFVAVALDESETYTYRWHALFSIRNSRQVAGSEAVVGVLTEENDLQLKIQAVWALCAVAEKLEHKELLQSEDGLIDLLKSEEVRRHDKENIIALLAYMKSKKSVPTLIELLDDTHVYSESMIEGEWEPNTMSKYAHEALVAITGANLPNDKEAWQEYWGGQMQDHPFIIAFGVIIVLVTLVLTVRRCAFSRSRRPHSITDDPAAGRYLQASAQDGTGDDAGQHRHNA